MGRTRTPTSIIAARGGLDRPCRAALREGEPEVDGDIGPAPSYFTPSQVEAWNDIVAAMYAGTYGSGDRLAVEVAALLLTKIRGMGTAVEASTVTCFQKSLTSFGLTPTDRSKVKTAPKGEEENPLGGLIRRPKLKSV